MSIVSEERGASALDQTANSRLSRRRFLQVAGAGTGLVVAFASGAPVGAAGIGSNRRIQSAAQEARRTPPTDLDSYLAIGEDGMVTLYTGKVEFGQGIQTGFGQLIAEELSIPFERVKVVMGFTDKTPYDLGTFGSLSTRLTGPRLQRAAAEMRRWLVELGAEELGVPAEGLTLEGGSVVATDNPNTAIEFATLAAGKQSMREVADDVPLKDPNTYTIVGQSIPRVDVPLKVNGTMKYGIDATLPGVVYGKIVRPPALGATLQSIDFSEAESMPGVVGTFHEGEFAGLAAERYEQAVAAVAAVQATWSEVNTGNTSANVYELIVSTADAGISLDEEEHDADPDKALAGVAKPFQATFRSPYVNHAPIEPKSAMANVTADRVDIYTSTQAPFDVQSAVAAALAVDLEKVVVSPMAAGGAFGSKIVAHAEVEAARLSKAFGRPVKVVWSRPEEFQYSQYRPAVQIDIQSGLDADGKIVGWKYDLYNGAYFPETAEAPSPSASDWSANALEIYQIPESKTMQYQGQSPLPPYFWRVNGASTNTHARESAIDELAEMAGVDPVSFRADMLAENPRMLAVMQKAVEQAGWQPGVGSTGQGIGIALGFDAGTFIAEVAHVEVDETTGVIRVKHVDVVADPGIVVNPEAAACQLEGSVVLALSPALREQITFDNGRVTNASWGQYQPLRMNEVPTVTVSFLEDKTSPMSGIGEPGVAPAAAAVSNAVYDAIGVRLRETPFTPDRVLAALAAKAQS
jgi:isoquinoline 1-oxidoreductase